MGKWWKPKAGTATAVAPANRLMIEQNGITRTVTAELLFQGAKPALLGANIIAALGGTSGTPGADNKFVTDDDPRQGWPGDVRAFEASPDAADNAAAINAALAASNAVVVRGGDYIVLSPVVVTSGKSLLIESGASITAGAGFTGSAPVQAGTVGAIAEGWSIHGDGTINADNKADIAVDVIWGRFASIRDGLLIRGGNQRGIRVGAPGTAYRTYEVHIRGLRGVWYNDVPNQAGSIGVYFEEATDCYCDGTIVMGYRVGFKNDHGNIRFSNNHPWVRAVHGAFTHGYWIAGQANLTNNTCDALNDNGDAAITAMYEYFVDAFDVSLNGNRGFNGAISNNAADITRSAKINAIYINKDYSGVVVNGFTHTSMTVDTSIGKLIDGYIVNNVSIHGLSDDGRVVDSTNTVNRSNFKPQSFGYPVTVSQFTANGAALFNGASTMSDPLVWTRVRVRGNAGTAREYVFQSGTTDRWIVRVNATAEDGTGNGSNFEIISRNDDGTYLATPFSVNRKTGAITTSGAIAVGGAFGHAVGAGGVVAQLTGKATGVTLDKYCGQVTMHNEALAANTTVLFTVTCDKVAATDIVKAIRASGGTAGAYQVWVDSVAAGSFVIAVRNITVGSLSESPVITFQVTKAVAS